VLSLATERFVAVFCPNGAEPPVLFGANGLFAATFCLLLNLRKIKKAIAAINTIQSQPGMPLFFSCSAFA